MNETKPRLILVDGDVRMREQVAARLAPLYAIKDFSTAAEAMRHGSLKPPDAMVIADQCARAVNYSLIQSIRVDPLFAGVPIIILTEDDAPERHVNALRAGATSCLGKPYRPNNLVQAISLALNSAVEKRWAGLPPAQAAALASSLAAFRSVSDQIAVGGTITYTEIGAACQPLLEAVNADEVKPVLQGVRNYDNYTFAHSLRVAVFLTMFGRSIGLAAEDQQVLTVGGLLHDLGKVTIPLLILNKAGHLAENEFEVMKGHVPATMKLLKQCPHLPRAAYVIAGQHHERMDGTGYPHGLRGSSLNDLARMAAIADVFSALTDRRVYKPAMAPERAFGMMSGEMAPHFDPRLLKRFRQMMLDTKIG